MYRAGIITASDKGFRGEREDESGRILAELLEGNGYRVERAVILPDDRQAIGDELAFMTDEMGMDVVFTTGGTGFSQRDVTPEATADVADRDAPGIAEAIRALSMQATKRAMLSRGRSVIRKNTLIVNLPGSPKAVRECLEFVLDTLGHGLDVLKGDGQECARERQEK